MVIITPFLTGKSEKVHFFGLTLYLVLSAVYFLLTLTAGVIFILASLQSDNVTLMAQLVLKFLPPHYATAGLLAVAILKSVTAALVIQLCISGLYGILLIINVAADRYTTEVLEKRKEQIDYIKIASAKLKLLSDKISDKEVKRKVESVYDAVSSSPVKSHMDLIDIETRILKNINELDNEIHAENRENIIFQVDSLLSAVSERNTRLKTLN
ncbi:MAG: hypothetical protein FWC19_08105 [Treponema sp.]|nr:hypothetical protein [Treponema sp.]